MMIRLDAQYSTQSGAAVRIFAIDGGGKYPVLGAYRDYAGEWCLARWTAEGRVQCKDCTDDCDLVLPTFTRIYWTVHFKSGGANSFPTREKAINNYEEHLRVLRTGPLAITGPHTVEFTEGEGVAHE